MSDPKSAITQPARGVDYLNITLKFDTLYIRSEQSFVHRRAMTPAEIKKLRVPELKEQLKERGLDTTGKKDVLVARLESALTDVAAASTEPAAAPVSERLPQTAVEALRATDFVLASAEHAKNCQSVCKLLFDLGAEHCLAPLPCSPTVPCALLHRVLSSSVRREAARAAAARAASHPHARRLRHGRRVGAARAA